MTPIYHSSENNPTYKENHKNAELKEKECDVCSFVAKSQYFFLPGTNHEGIFNFECGKCGLKRNKFYFNKSKQEHEPTKVLNITTNKFKENYIENGKKMNKFSCPQCSFQSVRSEDFIEHAMTHSQQKRSFKIEILQRVIKVNIPQDNPSTIPKINDSGIPTLSYREKAKISSPIVPNGYFTGEANTNPLSILKSYPATPKVNYKISNIEFSQMLNNSNDAKIKHNDDNDNQRSYNFACSKCDFMTFTKESFASHQIAHKQTFHCTECEFETHIYFNLRNHLLNHTSKTKLKVHQVTNDTSDFFQFYCDSCCYKTSTIASLIFHEMEHTGERTYNCYECDFVSISMTRLMLHQKLHKVKLKKPVYQSCSKSSRQLTYTS